MSGDLRKALDLSEYESRAYFALMTEGEVSPSELAETSEVPRPRVYDVLKKLVRKGLATERLGRPLRYAALDPRSALPSLSAQLDQDAQLEAARRRDEISRLTFELGGIYEEYRYRTGSEQRVTVGSSSRASWKQLESLRQQTENEYVSVSCSPAVPPYEIFAQEERMLEAGTKMKLIRPFPGAARRRHMDWYHRLIRKGYEIKSSDAAEFSFDVSDSKRAVIWLNERADHPPTEAVWLQHAPLARTLRENFEKLWRRAKPVEIK